MKAMLNRWVFNVNSQFDWESVEVNQGGDDVLPGSGVSKDLVSRALDVLQPIQGCVGCNSNTNSKQEEMV